jgi:hypothetical protein
MGSDNFSWEVDLGYTTKRHSVQAVRGSNHFMNVRELHLSRPAADGKSSESGDSGKVLNQVRQQLNSSWLPI